MIDNRVRIQSELNQLTKVIDGLPDEAIFDRIGLENRRQELTQKLEALPIETIRKRTSLTFKGKPVRGSRGISAEFGSRAAKAFSDAYSAIVAGVQENLRYMGPIPDRGNHELYIIGTAVGSFGFEFELPSVAPDLLSQDRTLEETSVDLMRELMEVSATGSDEEISDIAVDIHPRAVRKVAEFVSLLAQSEATCALEISGRSFRYADVDQLRQSASRLADENIKEDRVELVGAFIGFLPKSRNFEFLIAGEDTVVRGKVSPEIHETQFLADLLNSVVHVSFDTIQIGQGRPRYTLSTEGSVSRSVQS